MSSSDASLLVLKVLLEAGLVHRCLKETIKPCSHTRLQQAVYLAYGAGFLPRSSASCAHLRRYVSHNLRFRFALHRTARWKQSSNGTESDHADTWRVRCNVWQASPDSSVRRGKTFRYNISGPAPSRTSVQVVNLVPGCRSRPLACPVSRINPTLPA